MGCLSACAGNILKEMTESTIGASFLSGAFPIGSQEYSALSLYRN